MRVFCYSIIIPHKNIPNLLQRCLDSIPQRNDLEVIVVDDDSDPNMVDFDSFPGKDRKDTTIIFDKSGKGAGRARNIGLEHAKGKWLLFADADDFYNYSIRDILNDHVNSEADIIFFDSNSVESDTFLKGTRESYTHAKVKLYEINPKEAEFQLRYCHGVPWCKIVRHSMVKEHHVCFDETPINNDTTFAYSIGLVANTIKVDKRVGYCVTNREGSISVTPSDEKYLASIEVHTRKYRTLLDNGIDVLEWFISIQMKKLKSEGKNDLYMKGLDILHKYGFNESLIDKPYWAPPFVCEGQQAEDFLYSDFGTWMFGLYYRQNWKYKLLYRILRLRHLAYNKCRICTY